MVNTEHRVLIRLGWRWRLMPCGASDPSPDWGQGSSGQVPCVTCQWLGWHSCYKAAQLSVVGWLPASLIWFLASGCSRCNFDIFGWDTFLKQEVRQASLYMWLTGWETEISPRQGYLLIRLSETWYLTSRSTKIASVWRQGVEKEIWIWEEQSKWEI
jgi:hypothetical protein